MLQNEYLIAKIRVDIVENELSSVWMWCPTADKPLVVGQRQALQASAANLPLPILNRIPPAVIQLRYPPGYVEGAPPLRLTRCAALLCALPLESDRSFDTAHRICAPLRHRRGA